MKRYMTWHIKNVDFSGDRDEIDRQQVALEASLNEAATAAGGPLVAVVPMGTHTLYIFEEN